MLNNLNSIILELKLMRVLSYNLINNEDSLSEEDSIWELLNDIENIEQLNDWVENLKIYVWGSSEDFSKITESLDLDEVNYYKNRIIDIMGFELFKTIGNSENFWEFIEKNIAKDFSSQSENMILNFIKSSDERNELFLRSENNISVDENKVSRSIIFQLAEKICKEFSIRSLSFSNSISEVECFKYLLDLAYSLSDFSNIINSKNIGFNQLSLSFETQKESYFSTNYNLNFKQINFSINGYGAFSHEWFHFIDHRIGEKVPFSPQYKLFTELNVSNSPKKFNKLKCEINNKFEWKETDIRSIYAVKSMLLNLPVLLNSLLKDSLLNNKIKKILNDLDLIVLEINRYGFDFDKSKKDFYLWKSKFINSIKEIKNNDLVKEIESEILYVEKVIFNRYKLLCSPCWVVLSHKLDEKNKKSYLSNFSELMSRSFEFYILSKMGKRSWVSYNSNYNFSYPKGYEHEIENMWWDKNIGKFLSLAT